MTPMKKTPLNLATGSILAACAALALASHAAAAVEPGPMQPAAKKANNSEKAAAAKAMRQKAEIVLNTPPSLSPKSPAKPELKATAAKIDELVSANLAKEKIKPNAPVSDEI